MITQLQPLPPATGETSEPFTLANTDILRVWEIGHTQGPVDRALTILAAAYPHEVPEDHALFSIGLRDARLFAVREATFGSRFDCLATCSQCGEPVELSLDASEIRAKIAGGERLTGDHRLEFNGWQITFRLPDSSDLSFALVVGDPAAAQQRLVERCVQRVRSNGKTQPSTALNEEMVARLAAEMAARDPGAEIELALTCPGCGAGWQTLFDIGSFLWTEIDALAKRLLHEVATLARAYGWREADILALSATRRQTYLDLM